MSVEATVRIRSAVARACFDIEPGELVLVACSGGADSMALAAAAAFTAARAGWRCGAVIVDHGLQAESAVVASRTAELCRQLGLDPVRVVRVEVGGAGGPEAAARDARYAALREVSDELRARAVLLGHTRDDQAETVLIRLARGSGARSLSAMAPVSGDWRRPLLDITRAQTEESAHEVLTPLEAAPWIDPHNADPRFTRVRVRAALGELEQALGPGVAESLARSAELLRDDADALDAWADEASVAVIGADGAAECQGLAGLPRAVRTRIIRRMCLAAGSPGEDLTRDHVLTVERLVSDWSGQGPISLPGRVTARRAYDRLTITFAGPQE